MVCDEEDAKTQFYNITFIDIFTLLEPIVLNLPRQVIMRMMIL